MVFTGIVEEVGKVETLKDTSEGGVTMYIEAATTLDGYGETGEKRVRRKLYLASFKRTNEFIF